MGTDDRRENKDVIWIVMATVLVVLVAGIGTTVVGFLMSRRAARAKAALLQCDLQTVRSQIELYKIQHNESYPGEATFVADLTNKDANGYGPYLQRFPTNPFNRRSDVKVEAGTAGLGDGTAGWHFETRTKRFSANDSPKHAMW